jgi:hypothetical protein
MLMLQLLPEVASWRLDTTKAAAGSPVVQTEAFDLLLAFATVLVALAPQVKF